MQLSTTTYLFFNFLIEPSGCESEPIKSSTIGYLSSPNSIGNFLSGVFSSKKIWNLFVLSQNVSLFGFLNSV